MQRFGLEINKDYEGQGITIKHKNGDTWYELIKTTTKMLMYKDGDKVRRMRADSLDGINFGEKNEEVKEKEENVPFDGDSMFDGGVENSFFDNDFIMASDPHFVFDNDTMYM